jgi:DNA polymerase III, alpha subunit
MTANVITFRGRSAMRETSKALNLPQDVMDRFSRLYANGDFPHTIERLINCAEPVYPRIILE